MYAVSFTMIGATDVRHKLISSRLSVFPACLHTPLPSCLLLKYKLLAARKSGEPVRQLWTDTTLASSQLLANDPLSPTWRTRR